jgi:hypothetical protein
MRRRGLVQGLLGLGARLGSGRLGKYSGLFSSVDVENDDSMYPLYTNTNRGVDLG